ncbi:MAG: hypothetical protein M1836_001059 [Candelina mexicana]|nr:MAG: hypothetical protein M1836_001059 [Candelina mexicana]
MSSPSQSPPALTQSHASPGDTIVATYDRLSKGDISYIFDRANRRPQCRVPDGECEEIMLRILEKSPDLTRDELRRETEDQIETIVQKLCPEFDKSMMHLIRTCDDQTGLQIVDLSNFSRISTMRYVVALAKNITTAMRPASAASPSWASTSEEVPVMISALLDASKVQTAIQRQVLEENQRQTEVLRCLPGPSAVHESETLSSPVKLSSNRGERRHPAIDRGRHHRPRTRSQSKTSKTKPAKSKTTVAGARILKTKPVARASKSRATRHD